MTQLQEHQQEPQVTILKKDKMKESEKILLAVLGGAVAGAVLGILFAPAKGTETREKIFSGAQDLSDTIKEQASCGLDAIADIKERFFKHGGQITSETSGSNGSGQHV